VRWWLVCWYVPEGSEWIPKDMVKVTFIHIGLQQSDSRVTAEGKTAMWVVSQKCAYRGGSNTSGSIISNLTQWSILALAVAL
jgi:hypothetical protein